MKLSPSQVVLVLSGIAAYFGLIYFAERSLSDRVRPWFRYLAVLLTVGLFFYALGEWVPVNYKRAVEITKAAIAITAAAAVFYEQHRKSQGRPLAERWKKLVGVTLALIAISAYFNGYRFGYPKYYHRWDQYHYYMGAKYFPELGYTNLYRCAVIAEDEMGRLHYQLDRPYNARRAPERTVDLRAEMRDPDKKIRDLPGRDLLIPVSDLLEHPEVCKSLFSAERWEQYKKDVAFYRIVSGKGYWTDMQKDHGFNPPPVWTVAGKIFSDLSYTAKVQYLQFLATLDLLYLAATFILLWWGFGWRVFAVGAIFWGCQASAPFYWTGGAFLRQDWLFYTVASVACLRRRCFKLGGAAVVYAALLRVFPGLVVIGTLVPAVVYAIKHKRMHRDHLQMLIGGCLAAAILLPASILVTHHDMSKPWYTPYKTFYQHTIVTHDHTPLTNHMGLRVIIAHQFLDFQLPGVRNASEAAKAAGPKAGAIKRTLARIKWPITMARGKSSGQMRYTRNNNLLDPFEIWKRMRNERYAKYRWVAYLITGASMLFFISVVRRIKSLWVAQCLGQIFIILMSQLTCYYYSFMILAAPLIKLRRQIEVGLFGLAAITQIIWMNSYWNDNKYTLLTIASLVFCYAMLAMFWRRQPATAAGAGARVQDELARDSGDDDAMADEDGSSDGEEPVASPA